MAGGRNGARLTGAWLETISVEVPEHAVEPFEAALQAVCRTVGLFLTDEDQRIWTIEGVKRPGEREAELVSGLALAALVTGENPDLSRRPTQPGGWLARTQSAFPEQCVGRRFAIRGHPFGTGQHGRPDHLAARRRCGVRFGRARVYPRLPAGRSSASPIADPDGCWIWDAVPASWPWRAAKLLHRPVIATDIDAWSTRVARENAVANGLRNPAALPGRDRLATGGAGESAL